MKRILVLVVVALLCVGLVRITSYSKDQPVAGNAVEAPATAAPPLSRQPATYGINLSFAAFWSRERAFMNLAAGGGWNSIRNGVWSEMPSNRVDPDGTVHGLLPGESIALSLTRPPRSRRGDLAIRCRFDGQGTVNGVAMVAPQVGPGRIDFTWRQDVETAFFRIDATDPVDPIRHIDCREADADPKLLFDPAFVDSVRPYRAVRFMDWMQANMNRAGDWTRRTLPTSTIQAGPQGVAVEHLVALANQAKVDPWFVMPWNADATYMEKFARYVHDHLDPARTAYVEIGNEVWNLDFPAGKQALAEGKRLKLGATDDEARMRRYAQRSVEGFMVWERVFADAPRRIVRILSGQNAWIDPFMFALTYQDTARHIDALSSAVYFGQTLLAEPPADTRDLTPLFAQLDASIASTFEVARRYKAAADARGLRYIAYEGGQHANYSGPDRTLVTRLNRDPRMGEAYRRFMTGWDREFGDLLMIYHSTSPIGTSMHFGLQEYSGQPLAEAPKRKAVLEVIGAAGKR
ncbi:hypothetical protein [Rhizorhabdus dicambivorans]|nr:hypothetical protein [Rhizorhabdus dicambivorans]